ncbi:MAG: NAD(P)/FAD-dependent oxidoreductase [Pseudomonadota bacterium]|nr:NAD(P)/FAD-dependent oxidoreductase [Pseudomonadota bacterium]
MIRITNVKLPLDHTEAQLTEAVLSALSIKQDQLVDFTVFRRGFDARARNKITLLYTIDVETNCEGALLKQHDKNQNVRLTPDMTYKYVAKAPENLAERPVVVGFGPCGIFVGLVLAEMGYKPIILDRGKEVRERTKDTFGFWRTRTLDTESNVQFGEGGAGTFSDGKLYTQINDKKHYGRKVLNDFVDAGAPEEILYVSKPHIGTFKLVGMVEKMRAKIVELGGEIRFNSRVDDLHIEGGQITGLTLSNGQQIKSKHIALATGHSARDTFEMLHDKSVYMEAKSFSIGFRIEHNQSAIDEVLFGKNAGNPILGAADYKLVHHCKNGRSVYSFCMCPGGTVVAATSEENRVVTNGMSQYSRNERNANSAIVVGIDPEDYPSDSPLAGIELQRQLESAAYVLGGQNYDAPAQLVGDYLEGKSSEKFGKVEPSYKPGVKFTDMTEILPQYCLEALREAIPAFNKKIRGFALKDAMLTGVETRTSSPVSIKRDRDYQSINTKGLYPAGEGAGYAGGIMSAAIDGIRVAEAMALAMNEEDKN